MEDLIIKVEQILNQYATEELGNRASQFSLLALKQMIINEIKSYNITDKNIEKKSKQNDHNV